MELIKKRGIEPSFFIKKYNNLKYICLTDSRLLKENYFDAFTIDLKIYKWQIKFMNKEENKNV